jgi:hypothetical protein
MRRRELLGWTVTLGVLGSATPGLMQYRDLQDIEETNETPLDEALDDLEDDLEDDAFNFAVLPEEAYAHDEIERQLQDTYTATADGDPATVEITADTTNTAWDGLLDTVLREQYEQHDDYVDVDTIYGRALDEFGDADDFVRAVHDDEDLLEEGVRTTASLLGAYIEATAAGELQFYEDSERAEDRGVWATLLGVSADPDRQVDGYHSRIEGIEVDGQEYAVEHTLTPEEYTGDVQGMSFDGSLENHLELYRERAALRDG